MFVDSLLVFAIFISDCVLLLYLNACFTDQLSELQFGQSASGVLVFLV